jgi:hypothetical protein
MYRALFSMDFLNKLSWHVRTTRDENVHSTINGSLHGLQNPTMKIVYAVSEKFVGEKRE